jgi:ATP-dependent helicase/nuclease subunit B
MKEKFHMSKPERNIGVCAADFAHLMHAPEVFLTRAQKADGIPTDKSRWWLRLETVLEAVFGSEKKQKEEYAFMYQQAYSPWAKNLERCNDPQPINPPLPCPDVKYRPRSLSASKVEILMRDPYYIYAQKVLHLYPLKDLDREMEVLDFGNMVHEVLEEFCRKYDSSYYPEDAAEQLMKMGLDKFVENKVEDEVIAFWKPQLKEFVDIVVRSEKERRPLIEKIHQEINGEVKFQGEGGDFVISGKADRIEELKDKSLCIIDYKTGHSKSTSEIEKATAPQLPIEALIAESGGYKDLAYRKVTGLQYWALKDKGGATDAEQSEKAVAKIKEVLQKLIDEFDDKDRPYLVNSLPGTKGHYDDYDHLSRVLEWSVRDES